MKSIVILILVWVVFAVIGYVLGMNALDQYRIQRLSDKGVAVYGRVVATEVENHNLVHYSYRVNGIELSGSGGAGNGNPNFDELLIGQDVVVYYDPNKVDDSILGYPHYLQAANESMIRVIVLVLPIPPVVIALLLIILLSKTASPARSTDDLP